MLKDIKRSALEISGLRRLDFLSAVADLGLEIRGAYWNIECLRLLPEIFLCYNNKQVYSLKDNEEFYNSAKIS